MRGVEVKDQFQASHKITNSTIGLHAGEVGNTEIDISVVVPFYNAEKHIEECINSLLAQSYRRDRYEIIMIDNNSTDRSTAIVGRYPRINLLSEQKQGAYAARNRGIGASRGAIIVFTDADCVACSEWLQEIASAMGAPEIQLIQGGRLYGVKSPALSMLESYDSERSCLHLF